MALHRLPNGKTTSSQAAYIAAWRDLAKPFVKGMGCRLGGFDPDLMLIPPKGYHTFNVPADVAIFVRRLWEEVKNGHPAP